MRTGFRLSARHAWQPAVSLVVLAAFCETAHAAAFALFTVSPSANVAASWDFGHDSVRVARRRVPTRSERAADGQPNAEKTSEV
jgi:hypothetical protein